MIAAGLVVMTVAGLVEMYDCGWRDSCLTFHVNETGKT
jgi:hypothetical protein